MARVWNGWKYMIGAWPSFAARGNFAGAAYKRSPPYEKCGCPAMDVSSPKYKVDIEFCTVLCEFVDKPYSCQCPIGSCSAQKSGLLRRCAFMHWTRYLSQLFTSLPHRVPSIDFNINIPCQWLPLHYSARVTQAQAGSSGYDAFRIQKIHFPR